MRCDIGVSISVLFWTWTATAVSARDREQNVIEAIAATVEIKGLEKKKRDAGIPSATLIMSLRDNLQKDRKILMPGNT